MMTGRQEPVVPQSRTDYTSSPRWCIGFILVLIATHFIFRSVLRKYYEEQTKSLDILFFNDDITVNGPARSNVDNQLREYIDKYYPPEVITEYTQRMKPLDGREKKLID
ncbi:unnamed protein product [Litomosoides sigmodontis]|uniref:Uncharacterized protein n=1 Tax=Litomosoides sigmodontis TaxID=42156 RepID=A0A3P6SAY1_LITSI|nr:unnamed protein product [Litomosoides sigmodontis]